MRFARFVASLAALLVCSSWELRADLLPAYVYVFTMPTLDGNGNPDGGRFTTGMAFSPGPLRNIVMECNGYPITPCGPFSFSSLGSGAPMPGLQFVGASWGNVGSYHPYDVAGFHFDNEEGGAWVELDYSGSAGFLAFGFSATDDFWKGPGGPFGSELTGGGPDLGGYDLPVPQLPVAMYRFATPSQAGTSYGAGCAACSVAIVATPEPGSIALLATVIAGLSVIGVRRRSSGSKTETRY